MNRQNIREPSQMLGTERSRLQGLFISKILPSFTRNWEESRQRTEETNGLADDRSLLPGKSYASLFLLYTVFSFVCGSVCNVRKKVFDEDVLFSALARADYSLEQFFRVLFCFWEVGYPIDVFH